MNSILCKENMTISHSCLDQIRTHPASFNETRKKKRRIQFNAYNEAQINEIDEFLFHGSGEKNLRSDSVDCNLRISFQNYNTSLSKSMETRETSSDPNHENNLEQDSPMESLIYLDFYDDEKYLPPLVKNESHLQVMKNEFMKEDSSLKSAITPSSEFIFLSSSYDENGKKFKASNDDILQKEDSKNECVFQFECPFESNTLASKWDRHFDIRSHYHDDVASEISLLSVCS